MPASRACWAACHMAHMNPRVNRLCARQAGRRAALPAERGPRRSAWGRGAARGLLPSGAHRSATASSRATWSLATRSCVTGSRTSAPTADHAVEDRPARVRWGPGRREERRDLRGRVRREAARCQPGAQRPLALLRNLGELGVVGFGLLCVVLIGAGVALVRRIRRPERTLYAAAFAVALARAVHAGFDWDWQMPAITLPAFVLAGAAVRSAERGNERRPTLVEYAGRSLRWPCSPLRSPQR
jgi:hypothetical protein